MTRLQTLGYGPNNDPDQDDLTRWQEYMADTDPLDGSSYLAITKLLVTAEGVGLQWQGGIGATQSLERLEDLNTNAWETIYTRYPRTPASGSHVDTSGTSLIHFYRLKTTR